MPVRPSEEFQRNVFINCPFDHDYTSLLRPLLFTIIDLGFNPRSAEGFSDEDLSMMPVSELIAFIREWVRVNPA